MNSTRTPLSAWLRSMPQLTVAAATMYGCGSVLLAAGAATWHPGRNPRWVIVTLAIVALALLVWTLARGRRFTADEALVLTAVQLFTVGSLTWTTHLTIAAFANGTVLPIIGVFVVWFLRPVGGRIVLYAGTVWWFAAVVHQTDSSLVPFAATMVVQTLIATEVFSRIKHRMDRLARTDPLTGTLNRRGITEVLDDHIDRARRRGRALALVAVDLDGLREINNTRGHRAGDQLLETITRHWIGNLRRGDDLGRVGGDEFVFVLPDTTFDEAQMFVRRMSASSPGAWSAGVATAGSDDTVATLLERADQRMYVAKAARHADRVPVDDNRPSVETWTDPMNDTYDRRGSTTRP